MMTRMRVSNFLIDGLRRFSARALWGSVAVASLAIAALPTQATTFNGFNDRFNLGRSAASGAVCEAKRGFEDPLIAHGARVWNVTCRGWSHRLGKLYQFPASKTDVAVSAWRAALAAGADCNMTDPPKTVAGVTAFKPTSCKTKPAGLDYVAYLPGTRLRPLAAEGMAPIADVLAAGLKFMSGASPEPQAVAEQGADVGQVAAVHVDALSLAGETQQSAERRRRQAYSSGQDWKFGDAEAVFAALAGQSNGSSASSSGRAEALYNFALNVSNKGRFSEADVYFEQAKALAQEAGPDAALQGLGLNYLAAHARNQTHYEDAIKLADAAIAARHAAVTLAPVVRAPNGSIEITEVGGVDATDLISSAQREQLRDAQALEIKATSLESLGRKDEARAAIVLAAGEMTRRLVLGGAESANRLLGEATPWLNTQIRADALRLDAGTDRAPEAERQYRIAVNAFAKKYPNSLPLAGYLVELARDEAASASAAGAGPATQDEKALSDYETAFEIFRAERGSLEASADLVRTYFDILLRRIGTAPASDPKDVARFFNGAQTLISQSSAEAAKRQAAHTLAGGEKAAGLARALEDTGRSLEAKTAELRDLQQRDAYKGDAKNRIDTELKSLVTQSDTLEAQLLQADPHYASLLRKAVDLSDLQKTLQPGEVYVKAFVLSGRGYGILVSATEATPYAIDLSHNQARAMVAAFRRPIDNLRTLSDGHKSPLKFDVALAHQFFLKIFGPVQSSVLAAKHVIYEPDASLIAAPIAAFVTDAASVGVMQANLERARNSDQPLNYVGVAWLGNHVTTSTALSATAFVQARHAALSKAAKPFFGFGDPQISNDPRAFADVKPTGLASANAAAFCNTVRESLMRLSALPETVREIKSAAESLGQGPDSYALGAAFTDADIERRGATGGDLANYKVLYFATHGILPQPNGCMQSALLTSLSDVGGDGLLDEKKIPQLNLDADMIVLSACDTGSHGDNSGGEALGGLVSTFVQAGARNVVVSNWEVDTRASMRLMQDMFARKSSSQADALAGAERSMMSSPDQYSHPYFWAPFTVVGDGARPMPAV